VRRPEGELSWRHPFLVVLELPEQCKEIRDRHHVLALLIGGSPRISALLSLHRPSPGGAHVRTSNNLGPLNSGPIFVAGHSEDGGEEFPGHSLQAQPPRDLRTFFERKNYARFRQHFSAVIER